MSTHFLVRTATVFFTCIFLAACGGGSGDDSSRVSASDAGDKTTVAPAADASGSENAGSDDAEQDKIASENGTSSSGDADETVSSGENDFSTGAGTTSPATSARR